MRLLSEYFFCYLYILCLTITIKPYLNQERSKIYTVIFLCIYALINFFITGDYIIDFDNYLISNILVILCDFIMLCIYNNALCFYILFYTSCFFCVYSITINCFSYIFFLVNINILGTYTNYGFRVFSVFLYLIISYFLYKMLERLKIIPSEILIKENCIVYNVINVITVFVFLIFFGLHLIELNIPFIVFIFFTFVILWITLLYFLNRSIVLQLDNENLSIANIFDDNVEIMIDSFRNENEKVMEVKHDIKNHLQILKTMNNLYDVKEYINDLYTDITDIKVFEPTTNIQLIDIIFNLKKNQYPSIRFSYDVSVDYININEKHFSTILFNLIDNACQNIDIAFPNVNIQIIKNDETLLITVTNTTDRVLSLNTQNTVGHGYGLKIIQYYAEKYDGSFFIKMENSIVISQVILKCNNKK